MGSAIWKQISQVYKGSVTIYVDFKTYTWTSKFWVDVKILSGCQNFEVGHIPFFFIQLEAVGKQTMYISWVAGAVILNLYLSI